MISFNAPNTYKKEWYTDESRLLFMAGGITGTSNWQTELLQLLESEKNLIVANPRREDFDVTDPAMKEYQIAWERKYLICADFVSFWFPPETYCPITLFELGASLSRNKMVFIGCHPDYKRIRDVKIQSRLHNPDIVVVENLPDLADRIKNRWR